MKNIILYLIFCVISFNSFGQNKKYFRQLSYNHVSPMINIIGIHPIDSIMASKSSHYIFKYDETNRLIEIRNHHYHTEKVHPLSSLGVYKVVFTYENHQEIRTFFDPNNKRIVNDRKVYKEVYLLNKDETRKQLNFYDLADRPMESNWKIAEYTWEKAARYFIERRYNLKGELVNLSPYFEFGITGIEVRADGTPRAHYNLNDQLEVSETPLGVASYQDTFDQSGNHIEYSYHDKNNELVTNQWSYALGEKSYDSIGNFIQLQLLDTEHHLVSSRRIYSNSTVNISDVASREDSLEIKKQSLGYLIALQELNPQLMDSVLNEDLNKITISYDRNKKKQFARATSKSQMIDFATDWNASGNKFPPHPNNEVKVLDIYDRIATVKLTSNNWVEYLQLIKLDGKWEIMNLIWQYKDTNRYRK